MNTATRIATGLLRARSGPSTVRPPARPELLATLTQVLTPPTQARRIVDIETRPSPYTSGYAIEEIDVWFDDDTAIELVCKDMSAAAMLPVARRIKPVFLRDPEREIATYQSILAPLGVSAPRFYGRSIDRRRQRFWLFLERVFGPPLAQIGDFDVWLHVSGWLADLHNHPGLRDRAIPASVPLVAYTADHFRRWMMRACRFVAAHSWEPRSRRRRFEWLVSRYPAVIDELAALPTTFVHGEFYASNVLVDMTGGLRVRPLDWELAGIGTPFIDLAALTAGWDESKRQELTLAYYRQVEPETPLWLPPASFRRALDACRLQLAMQCLGWARHWSPPKPHAQDWLGEALMAAERLGL